MIGRKVKSGSQNEVILDEAEIYVTSFYQKEFT